MKNDNMAKGNSIKVKDSKKLFFSGVIVLTLANVLVKVIGALLKVPLHSILTDEGMGYYTAAYEVYVWFYMISTSGLSVAISIMISNSRAKGHFNDSKRIFRVVFAILAILGVLGTALMMALSRPLTEYFYKLPSAFYGILAIAPTLFFICLSSAYRGYFQGHQNMVPTAISEVIEAVGKLIFGIVFANYARSQGYPFHIIAAFTLLGLSIGTACSMLYLLVTKLFFKEREYNAALEVEEDTTYSTPIKEIFKTLLLIGIPITISSSIMSLTNVIDGMILSSRLQHLGYIEEEAAAMLGNFKTLAVTMFNLPPTLIYPITASIVPLLSAAVSGGKKKMVTDTMNSSLRVCSIIAFPCAFGLSALSYPLLCLLFDEPSSRMAAPLLSVLAPSIFFLGMLSVTNSFLQSHKFQNYPIISMCAGAVVKLLSSYILIGTRGIEMYGAPIGTFLCYLTIMLLNFYFVAKKIGYKPHIGKIFVKPFIAGVVCALAAFGVNYLLASLISPSLSAIIAVCAAAVVYLVMIIVLKAFTREDILLLPKGNKIANVLEKYKVI